MTDTPALGIEVAVLRVFTDAAGNFGNPLGVVDAAAVPAPRRQALATELGYSETVFVDLPAAGATTARAWIFTPATELSFAGHPTVGAAWWLRERGTPVETLQVPAGTLQVRYSGDRTAVVARAEWGPEFVFHALASVDQVLAADPAAYADDGYHYLWAWLDRHRGHIRSRMFANEPGVPEDEATGSAAVRLTGELRRDLTITQGLGSQILTTWHPEGWVAVQGRVVSDGVRRLGAKPPSVAAQSDSIVPVMPVVPRSRELSAIEIKRVRPRVDELLSHYESAIGADFPGYRNHVYRTITYAMHFLDGAAEDERLVETAMVYHDIGLWTDHELAYLEPSEAVALADNEKFGWGLDPEALRGAIHWHHKVLPYRGPHERIIEACRKADWIDASKGLVRKGVSRTAIKAVEAAFPNRGFHATLLRLAKDYGGSTPVGGWKVTRGIVKW